MERRKSIEGPNVVKLFGGISRFKKYALSVNQLPQTREPVSVLLKQNHIFYKNRLLQKLPINLISAVEEI